MITNSCFQLVPKKKNCESFHDNFYFSCSLRLGKNIYLILDLSRVQNCKISGKHYYNTQTLVFVNMNVLTLCLDQLDPHQNCKRKSTVLTPFRELYSFMNSEHFFPKNLHPVLVPQSKINLAEMIWALNAARKEQSA